MGTKDLFENPQGNKILTSEDFDKEVQKVESLENVEAKFYEKRRFMPNVDFRDPKSFARYGLAKDYYVDAVDRIVREYPYDGSLKERTIFLNSSSYLDHYVFESRYPRTTGYIKLSAGGWGDLDGSILGEYGKPEDVEYIRIFGGPNTASAGMTSGSLRDAFTGSNIYDTDIYGTEGILANGRLGTRESNLQFNPANGCTIEFWMRKYAYASEASTKKEVIFDLWNQNVSGSSTTPSYITDDKYGRVTLELSGSTHGDAGADTFRLSVQSGSSEYGFFNQSIAASTVTSASVADKHWHHYAVTMLSASAPDNHGTQVRFYVDGKLNNTSILGNMGVGSITGSLVANIGALVASPSGTTYASKPGADMVGYGKLSASLDEFRYWKVARTDEQILNNYKYQVGGGTNTDISNTELGVYYKFNEGITQTSSVDSTVLDYSGRISNGKWTGYTGASSRNTGSAMVSASVIAKEYRDPIVYPFHSEVAQLRNDLSATGSLHDYQNNSSLYYSLPDWVTNDDQVEGSEQLKKLSQILASHFDTLHLQMESLSSLKDNTYLSSSFKPSKPVPFANRLLTSTGFVAPEIFADADLVAQILSRDEEREFELDLNDIKNFIYKNVYNNLVGIYKAKGTEKAFRNLIRCYGIGDEVVKLKAYGNNVVHPLEDTHYMTAVPKRTINFNDPDHFGATVFQHSGTTDEQRSYAISGAAAFTSNYTQRVDAPFTIECEAIFPKKLSSTDEEYFTTDFVSSSICGWHRAYDSDVIAESFQTFHDDDYNLQVYAVRPERGSDDAYFVLTGSNGNIGIAIETDTYTDVYNNEKWNFAVRARREKRVGSGRVTGSAAGSATTDPDGNISNTVVEFIGLNYDGDILRNSFHVSGNTNITGAIDLMSAASKRFYVGADRTGFSGSVLTPSDVKISALRYWQSFVDDYALDMHAKDVYNYGTLNPYRNAFIDGTFADGMDIPQVETLALHWDFAQVTGSDSTGGFIVQDASSGSVSLASRYGGMGKVIKAQHTAQGFGFKASSTASVSVEYLNTARQHLPESINSSDSINILTKDDDLFTRSSAITQYFYTFEKNMYDTISQEMVNMFGTIAEYNNLIGEPVYRYRQEYKAMNKLRALFFERIGNTPSLDKYIDYYKWIDESLSAMLRKLAPISADVDPNVRTIIESHILERNKYQSQYPLMDTRGNTRFGVEDIEGTARGINELTYNWKHGHAPLPDTAATATWTFTDKPNEASTITLTDADGVSVVFEVDNDGDGAAGSNTEMDPPTNNAAGMATIMASVVNDSVLKMTAAADGAKVTLTQDIKGEAGNTAITLSHYSNWDANTSAAFPTSFAGGSTPQAKHSLWWKDRALRADAHFDRTNTDRPSGDAAHIDRDKEKYRNLVSKYDFRSGHRLTQQDVSTEALIYTGSTYATNRFARPYKISAYIKNSPIRDIRSGYNFDGTKNFDFVLNSLRDKYGSGDDGAPASHSYFIQNLEQEVDIDDVTEPNEKKKAVYSLTYGSSPTTGHNTTENKLYARHVAPFALVSSSVTTGYQKSISHLGFDVAGLHTDGEVEGAMQGPFTERHVGGLQYRHADINFSGSKLPTTNYSLASHHGLDNPDTRPEGFDIIPGSSNLAIQTRPKSTPRAMYYRYPVAKRPLNIANIRQTTNQRTANGSTRIVSGTLNARIGNFSRVNQVVFAGDRGTNNQAFVRNEGAFFESTASAYVETLVDYAKLTRDVAEHTVVERFSAPGSPETAGDSLGGPGLDSVSAQYSPYNNLNYRNLGIRIPLRTMLTGVTAQFGFRSGIGEQTNTNIYSGLANFHKVHRNTGKRLEITNEFSVTPAEDGTGGAATVATSSYYDNFYVQHMIPQSDTQYSWITGSHLLTNELGYFPYSGVSRIGITKFAAATATITVADGDAASGMTEGEKITITSTDGTVRVYRLCDDTLTTITTGAELDETSDTGAGTTAETGDIAVVFNIASSEATQNAVLVQLKAAIESENGHNGKIEVSAVPGEADGAQAITLTQAKPGFLGNKSITTDISQITAAKFTGGSDQQIIYGSPVSFVSQSDEKTTHGSNERTFSTTNTDDPTSTPVLFNGMITNIVEPANTSSALLGNPTSIEETSYINIGNLGTAYDVDTAQDDGYIKYIDHHSANAKVLNSLLLHRNGPYGFPTWKQIRVGDNALTRLLRKNNKISVMIPAEEQTTDTSTIDEDHTTATATSRAKRGTVANYLEPAVVSRYTPLRYRFSYKTTNTKGEPINRNVVIRCTLGNSNNKFTNTSLNDRADFHSNEKISTSYDDIKGFYLDGALQDPDSPIDNFLGLEYKERIYPAESNASLGRIRTRNQYDSKFWRDERADRTKGGAHKTHDYSDQYTYYHSMWPLDAGVQFTVTGTANSPVDASEGHARPGILQAGWATQCYEYGYGGDAEMARLQPGPLYARFHLLSSTSSVVAPTGMEIPETGSELGQALRPNGTYSTTYTNYQFSGNFATFGPDGFPGHGGDSSTHLGTALWQAPMQAGRVVVVDGVPKFINEPVNPFYDSYSDYVADLRPLAKNMSIIPEFRISEHIDFYVKQNSENFLADNPQFLSIAGATTDEIYPINSSGSQFYKIFSYSDFMKHFRIIKQDHEQIADPTEITLECKALKKFLPYKGFYPADRTVQIATQWSSSYGQYIQADGDGWDVIQASAFAGAESIATRPFLQAFFAPGILYNSIKSGLSVDWPCVTGSQAGGKGYLVSMHGPKQLSWDTDRKSCNRMGWGTGSRGERGWDYRVPFEALLEPEKYLTNIPLSDMEVELNLSRIQLSSSWNGQGDKLYKMMMNNFLAETTKFFLKGKKLTRITSADERKFKTAASGTTYTARVKLYRSMNMARPVSGSWGDYPIPQDPEYTLITGIGDEGDLVNGKAIGEHLGLRETFTMYSRPTAFGPPVAGHTARNELGYDPNVFDSQTGYNPSFTPPYYHGEAWADILWTAEMDGKPTLDEIFSTAKIYNIRIDGDAFWSPGATGSADNSMYQGYEYPMASGNANAYSMQMVHSFNFFGKGSRPLLKRRRGRRGGDSDEVDDVSVWVIEPKWETPMYNFNNEYGIGHERMLAGTDENTNLIMPSASSGKGTVPRGMWHQFGVIPTSSDIGVFMQIEDIPENWIQNANNVYGLVQRDGRTVLDYSLPTPGNNGINPRNTAYNNAESLVDLCGFRTTARRLGETAKRKKVSEAIVAIPFYVEDGDMRFFDIDADTIRRATDNIETGPDGSPEDFNTESVEQMMKSMEKYIFPPRFDFIKYPEQPAVSMYVFEFSHVFDQDDLSHIWQNLPPKIGRKTIKARSTIKHRLLSTALMGAPIFETGERMKDEVQWMVFKVKQRAEKDYFKVTSNTTPQLFHGTTGERISEDFSFLGEDLVDTRFEHEENPAIPDYSYNWPYDFFSLVEFAGIDSKVAFETPEAEDNRLGANQEVGDTVARQNSTHLDVTAPDAETTLEEENVTPDTITILEDEGTAFDESWYENVDDGSME